MVVVTGWWQWARQWKHDGRGHDSSDDRKLTVGHSGRMVAVGQTVAGDKKVAVAQTVSCDRLMGGRQ